LPQLSHASPKLLLQAQNPFTLDVALTETRVREFAANMARDRGILERSCCFLFFGGILGVLFLISYAEVLVVFERMVLGISMGVCGRRERQRMGK
jgi:hypothetical protein